MSDEPEPETDEQGNYVNEYVKWLFEGSFLIVLLKISWNCMLALAAITMQLEEFVIILVLGGLIIFIAHDYENWYFEPDPEL